MFSLLKIHVEILSQNKQNKTERYKIQGEKGGIKNNSFFSFTNTHKNQLSTETRGFL